MNLSIAICDDNKVHRHILLNYINKILFGNRFTVKEYNSGEHLIKEYPKKVDILLLDINMVGIDGLVTAKKIREFDTNVIIIFTTSFTDFMQQGYEVRAFRYLVKPITFDNFNINFNNAVKEVKNNYDEYIVIKLVYSNDIIRIPFSSILYSEKFSRHVLIHTDTDAFETRLNLNELQKNIDHTNFYRCHRSFIINIKKVNSINKDCAIIKGIQIPVSRYKIRELKSYLTSSLGDLICQI